MPGDEEKPSDREGRTGSSDSELARRLDDLARRLNAAEQASRSSERAGGISEGGEPPPLGRALRLAGEFIGAVVVGGGLGWAIDRALGISPWGLIVFLMLGFAAGVLNVMRAAGFVKPRSGLPGQD